jgi:hypothetical protein
MAITFNSSAIDGGLAATGIYAHIVDVAGPKKTDATTNPNVAESWHVTYGVILHKDASTRASDEPGWRNLDTYPTMAVLYADLKVRLGSGDGNLDVATSIADA